jgi:hypothetical protein
MTIEGNTAPDKDTAGADNAPDKDTAGAKIYAGKYKSVEDLEAGYQNLQKSHGQQSNELGGVREQLTSINNNMLSMQQAQQGQPQQGPSFEEQRSKVVTGFKSGDIDEIGMATQLSNISAQETAQQTQAQYQKDLEKQGQEFNAQLTQRDQQQAYQQFTSNNPDFEPLLEGGQIQQMIDADPYVRDEYDAYYKIQANVNAEAGKTAAAAAFEAGKAEALAQVSGSDPSKSVTAGAGQQSPAPVGTEQSAGKPTKSQLLSSGLAAFQGAAT